MTARRLPSNHGTPPLQQEPCSSVSAMIGAMSRGQVAGCTQNTARVRGVTTTSSESAIEKISECARAGMAANPPCPRQSAGIGPVGQASLRNGSGRRERQGISHGGGGLFQQPVRSANQGHHWLSSILPDWATNCAESRRSPHE